MREEGQDKSAADQLIGESKGGRAVVGRGSKGETRPSGSVVFVDVNAWEERQGQNRGKRERGAIIVSSRKLRIGPDADLGTARAPTCVLHDIFFWALPYQSVLMHSCATWRPLAMAVEHRAEVVAKRSAAKSLVVGGFH